MEFQRLTIDEALPMYIKLKMVMNKYKHDELPISKRDVEKQCKEELIKTKNKAALYGLPNVCLCIYMTSDQEYSPLLDLYVEKDYRNMGYCTNLIRYCKRLNDTLYLHIFKENTRALQLYTKEGFKFTSTENLLSDSNELLTMVWNKNKENLTVEPDSWTDFSELTNRLRKLCI